MFTRRAAAAAGSTGQRPLRSRLISTARRALATLNTGRLASNPSVTIHSPFLVLAISLAKRGDQVRGLLELGLKRPTVSREEAC